MTQEFPKKSHKELVEIRIRQSHIAAVLWGAPLVFGALALFRELVLRTWGPSNVFGAMAPLMLENEAGLINWYSSMLLAAISAVLWLVALTKKAAGWRVHWRVLAAIFLYLSIDEAAQLHELLGPAAARFLHVTSPIWGTWIPFYALATAFLGAAFLPFVLGQHRDLQLLIFAGGLVYVGSALGLEIVELRTAAMPQDTAPSYFTAVARMQELGEILGLTIFLTGLLSWLSRQKIAWLASLAPAEPSLYRLPMPFRLTSGVVQSYFVLAIFTAAFQIYWRSIQCADACAASFFKAMIWGALWPLSWPVFLVGIFRALG